MPFHSLGRDRRHMFKYLSESFSKWPSMCTKRTDETDTGGRTETAGAGPRARPRAASADPRPRCARTRSRCDSRHQSEHPRVLKAPAARPFSDAHKKGKMCLRLALTLGKW